MEVMMRVKWSSHSNNNTREDKRMQILGRLGDLVYFTYRRLAFNDAGYYQI